METVAVAAGETWLKLPGEAVAELRQITMTCHSNSLLSPLLILDEWRFGELRFFFFNLTAFPWKGSRKSGSASRGNLQDWKFGCVEK